MPVRQMPYVGDRVIIVFLGTTISGVIDRVEEAGRRVDVLTEDGEPITFTLSRATGQFVANAGSGGARLLFDHRP
ncbi:MAG TPA: hypothetical protein VMF57_00290 [Solirubrobacteraceae bacterium]|nr:hypothetical protein [Solirubrobacteraceae bacterium]